VAAELAPARWAQQIARNLSALRAAPPAGSDGGLPERIRLLDLPCGLDPIHPRDLSDHWGRGGSPPRARLGVTGAGPFEVDLRHHGPHVLIAGTTGAGKSELLKTLVADLAVACPPERLSFLLIDYKGGAAFTPCAELPHVTGVLTDLDDHLSRRALAGLAAEIRHRERLLRAADAGDVDTYQRLRAADTVAGGALPPLPRLVIVVDEFRVLAEEVPDFVAGLIRTAAVGRSLGIHLVLATQRPAGAVSADIRANVNLRIALRVCDPADSEDVVGVTDAAGFSPGNPGRAVARTGGGPPVTFQAATVSERFPESTSVRVLHRGLAPPEPDDHENGPTDLDRIAAAARDAAARLGVRRVPAPWLPPLPEHVDLAELDAPPGAGHLLPYALADRPAAQAQEPLAWALGGGHLAVVGAPRSGRTTVLRTLATSAGLHLPPGTVHVQAVDGGAGLRDLAGLPHVGTVAAAADVEHCSRLLARLHLELGARRALLAAGDDWRVPGSDAQIVVLVDDWESVLQHWTSDHGRAVEELLRLVREGAGVGIQVALAGGRALLTGAVASLIGERVVLAMADPADAALAGVRPGLLPANMPPGRCIRLGGDDPTGVEAQVAVVTPKCSGPPQPISPRPWRLPPLPDVVRADDLSRAVTHDRGGGWIPVGLGGEETSIVGLPLEAVRSVLVAGCTGSGRSSALATLAAGVARHGSRTVLVISRGGVGSGSWSGEGAGTSGILARLDPLDPVTPATLGAHPGAVVVVDDVEQWLGTPLEAALSTHLRAAGTSRGRLIAACGTAEALAAYTGLLAELRVARTGLLLGPTGPGESEVLGVRLPPQPAGPPGRGLLVVRGRAGAVQVALPPVRPGLPERSVRRVDGVPGRPLGDRRPVTAPR
jgi:S-DNA-T family DNA segregation ATPase FtsK/SpoIIIE